MSDTIATVHCELCGLPHHAGAQRCDGCDHVLGTAPDLDALRRDLAALKKRILLGVLAVIAMLAVNLLAFQGAGIVLVSAPFAWIIHSAFRYRAVAGHLKRSNTRSLHP